MPKKNTFLTKDTLLPLIRQRIQELQSFILCKEADLRHAPAGSLRIIRNHSTYQYYHITKAGDRNGKYIPKAQFHLAKSLVQRDFDRKLLPELNKELDALQSAFRDYTPQNLQLLYDAQKLNRKQLITPVFQLPESLSAEWLSLKYKAKGFSPDFPELYTSKGIRVRSKSEVIIGDLLTRNSIPYRYEFPVKIKIFSGPGSGNTICVHPDFFCFNLNTGKEIIWEHFGLMDNPEYASKAVRKINDYALNGWLPGKNLIATFETSKNVINQRIVERLVKEYLK